MIHSMKLVLESSIEKNASESKLIKKVFIFIFTKENLPFRNLEDFDNLSIIAN